MINAQYTIMKNTKVFNIYIIIFFFIHNTFRIINIDILYKNLNTYRVEKYTELFFGKIISKILK